MGERNTILPMFPLLLPTVRDVMLMQVPVAL